MRAAAEVEAEPDRGERKERERPERKARERQVSGCDVGEELRAHAAVTVIATGGHAGDTCTGRLAEAPRSADAPRAVAGTVVRAGAAPGPEAAGRVLA